MTLVTKINEGGFFNLKADSQRTIRQLFISKRLNRIHVGNAKYFESYCKE